MSEIFPGYKCKIIEWIDPILLAEQIELNHKFFAFLYSGINDELGENSFIAFLPENEIKNHLTELDKIDDEQWFGYFSYDLKNEIENLPKENETYIDLPNLWFIKYRAVIKFNHKKSQAYYYYKDDQDLIDLQIKNLAAQKYNTEIEELASNMNKNEYLQYVKKIINLIREGVLYQANLTRKFYGKFKNPVKPFSIFKKLTKISPAAYSCFFKFNEAYIISSSPEQFLRIDNNKNIESRPIKGTIKRKQIDNDTEQINILANSEKDCSENLMIVDLMRNDFAKTCIPGSVKVKELFGIRSYATLHHMVSTITGTIQASLSNIEVLKGCFPPGSMTGAPKIKAMEICSGLEKFKRGVYSGCIGRFSKSKSVDLSVVIRTLIIVGQKFEFQVGGGIVYDSDPEKEFQETIVKARAIAKALKININNIKGI